MKKKLIKIDNVTGNDYTVIVKLINTYASQGFMLPKTIAQLSQLKYYFIAKYGTRVIGGVGIKEWSKNFAEIVSLVVHQEEKGRGIGTMLIEECIKKATRDGYKELFTLTLRPNLFKRIGFTEKPITSFPEKIWGDCQSCPKNASGPEDPMCNEIALSKLLIK
jgi:amino-acid N-acetyltransferase